MGVVKSPERKLRYLRGMMKGVATPGALHSVELTTRFVSKQQTPQSQKLGGAWCFGLLTTRRNLRESSFIKGSRPLTLPLHLLSRLRGGPCPAIASI